VRVALVLAALSAVVSIRAAEQPADTEAALARAAQARYDVVLLRDGIALAGKGADRRVEIARGVILSDGTPLSGDEVRRRFGADADLVLRLSYLDGATLHRIFRPAAPAVPPVAPTAPEAPRATTPPPAPVFDRPQPSEAVPPLRRSGARIGVAKRIVVAADEEVRDAVVSIGAPVRIEGRVRDGVVVVGGDLELAPTADVRGDLTVIGGTLTIADGAKHAGAIHHTIGLAWPQWSWSWPSFGWARFEPQGAGRWLPLAGTTARLVILAVILMGLAAVAGPRLQRIGAAAAAAPVRSGLTGLAIQLLFVPVLIVVAIALAVTIIGLPFVAILVPLAVLTLLGAMVVGFASLAVRVGHAVWGGDHGTSGAVAAALTGMAILLLPTLVARIAGVGPDVLRWPALALLAFGTAIEYVAWTIGLGAAARTGFGRWAVVPPPIPPTPPITLDPPMAGAPSAI
ncbi:MAG: hypothetical protein U0P30_07925, partial [Vicinamibacterales bacterium]